MDTTPPSLPLPSPISSRCVSESSRSSQGISSPDTSSLRRQNPPYSYSPCSSHSTYSFGSYNGDSQYSNGPFLHGDREFCKMEPLQDSDIPLFSVNEIDQQLGWDHQATTFSERTPPVLPTALPLMYDTCGGYGTSTPVDYSVPSLYAEPQQQATPMTAHVANPSGLTDAHAMHTVSAATRLPGAISLPLPILPSSGQNLRPEVDHPRASFDHKHVPSISSDQLYQHARPTLFPYQTFNNDTRAMFGTSGGSVGAASGLVLDHHGSTSVWRDNSPASAAGSFYSAAASTSHEQQPQHKQQPRQGKPIHSSVSSGPDAQSLDSRPTRRQTRRMTTKEDANFQCEIEGCGKLFSRSYNYKAHLETHDEKREYPFPCQVSGCNKRFVRKTDLQRHHQSVHAKERNHKCDYCGRLFARRDTLRRHMDDGCSKRFELGILEPDSIGAATSGSSAGGSRIQEPQKYPRGELPHEGRWLPQ